MILNKPLINHTPKKTLSVEEANKIMLEKIPLEERMQSVYKPITVMDCACYQTEELFKIFRELGMDCTKKCNRELHLCVDGYRRDNYNAMHSALYKDLEEKTKEISKAITKDINMFALQYQQAIMDRELSVREGRSLMIAEMYIVRELASYVIQLDREYTKRISDLLGDKIKYDTKDNVHCLRMIKAINDMFNSVGIPDDLTSEQIDVAFKVIKNRFVCLKAY